MDTRVDDIQDILIVINNLLEWDVLTPLTKGRLLRFKQELETELRFLLEASWEEDFTKMKFAI